jgi:hypothetical protein
MRFFLLFGSPSNILFVARQRGEAVRSKINFLFVVGLVFCTIFPAQAGDRKIIGVYDVTSRADRQTAAKELLNSVSRFIDLIPTPKPDDVAWVESEEAAISEIQNSDAVVARGLKLHNSAVYQHVKMHRLAQQVRDAFRCAINTRTTNQREVYCWAVAAFLLEDEANFGDGSIILVRSKRVSEADAIKAGFNSDRGVSTMYQMYARGIQENIVLPYLSGQLK